MTFKDDMKGRLLIVITFITNVLSATIVAWGIDGRGGNPLHNLSSSDLNDVTSIVGNQLAFAAIKTPRGAVSWGKSSHGGDSSSISYLLSNNVITKIAHTRDTFAALMENGRVLFWGNTVSYSFDNSIPLTDVKLLYACEFAYVAIKNDGTVLGWGYKGIIASPLPENLSNIKSISMSVGGFAALTTDGSVFAWQYGFYRFINYGGDTSTVAGLLKDVVQVVSSNGAFAALRKDDSVVTWGARGSGGDMNTVAHLLRNVTSIDSGFRTFVAHTSAGDAVAWGDWCEPDIRGVMLQLKGNSRYYSKKRCCYVAITNNKSVLSWGGEATDTSTVQSHLKDIKEISVTDESFVALTSDGNIVSWGEVFLDTSTVNHLLNNNTISVVSNYLAFAALVELPNIPPPPSEVSNNNPIVVVVVVISVVIACCLIAVAVFILRRPNINKSDQLLDESLLEGIDSRELSEISDVFLSSHEIPRQHLTDVITVGDSYYGKVFHGTYVTSCEVVIMRESLNKVNNENFINEIKLLSSIRQKDIVRFYGWSKGDDDKAYVITQYCEVSLLGFLKSSPLQDRAAVALRLISVARALAYIHGLGLAHMNLSTRNIFVLNDEFVLGNMETSTRIGSQVRFKLPLAWCPPEVFQDLVPCATTAHDVWGFGCTLFEIFADRIPHSNMTFESTLKLIKSNVVPNKPEILTHQGELIWSNIVRKCWNDVSNRITIQEIVSYLSGESGTPPPAGNELSDLFYDYEGVYYYDAC